MTTTVTIEVTPDEERYLHALVDRGRDPARPRNSLSGRLLFKLKRELPDPDEDLVFEMLSAYSDAAGLGEPVREALSPRMAEGMKAVLDLLRERDAS